MARITKPVEERQEEIIDTAQKLFKENGFDKTQIADISSAMNVAQGLFYRYFKSKTEILYAVIDKITSEQSAKIKQKMESHEGSALEALTFLLSSRPDYDCYDKLFPSLKSDHAIMEYCSQRMSVSALPVLLSIIERGNADGSWSCEYPKETAIFILQGFSGMIGLSDSPKHEEPKIQAFTSIIFRILGANPVPSP
jgi:AcrR family transcriptional regulator